MRFYGAISEAELAGALKALGGHARRLLEECVERQEVQKGKASKSAKALCDAGFLFIEEQGFLFDAYVTLRPSLLGEEALECLERSEQGHE